MHRLHGYIGPKRYVALCLLTPLVCQVSDDIRFFEGRGTGLVIATGAETEFGVIFSMMQDVCTISPEINAR